MDVQTDLRECRQVVTLVPATVDMWGDPTVGEPARCVALVDLYGTHPETWLLGGAWTPSQGPLPNVAWDSFQRRQPQCVDRPEPAAVRADVPQGMFHLVGEQFQVPQASTWIDTLKALNNHIDNTTPDPPHPLAAAGAINRDEHRDWAWTPASGITNDPIEVDMWCCPPAPARSGKGLVRSYVWVAHQPIDGRYFAGVEGIGKAPGSSPRWMTVARSGVTPRESTMIARHLGAPELGQPIETTATAHLVELPLKTPDFVAQIRLGSAPTELMALRAGLLEQYERGWNHHPRTRPRHDQ